MEEKPYKWLLQELCHRQISFKILETGICRGTKVIGWFQNSLSDSVVSKSVKIVNKTRYLINYFLNQRVPILEEYAPEKLICYLYHKTGKKIVTAKDAIELAENQLHGLQVTSIHMAISASSETYSLSAMNVGGELNTEIFIGKFGKPATLAVKDPIVIEKIINLLVYISDCIAKFSKQLINEIKIDFLFDITGYVQIIKVAKLVLKVESLRHTIIRKSSVKLLQIESSSEESFEEAMATTHTKGAISYILEKEKKNNSITVSIARPIAENTQNFLEMIANTFDRDRKKYEKNKLMEFTRNSVEESQKDKGNSKLFQLKSKNSFRESRTLKKSMNSLNDLLFYVEKTRPRIWLKDSSDVLVVNKGIHSHISIQKPKSRQVPTQIFTAKARVNHLDALISESNRIGKRIIHRSQCKSEV